MSINKEKVLIHQIQFGMFITELDRPWLESPFLLQGFVLERDEQMNALKNLCEFVYVDRTKSTGDQFGEKARLDVAIKRDVSMNRVVIKSTESSTSSQKKVSNVSSPPRVMVKTADNKRKTIKESSFFEVISAIKHGDIKQSEDGIIFNMRAANNASVNYTSNSTSQPSVAVNAESDGAFGFLKSLFGNKKEKLRTSVTQQFEEEPNDFGITESERFRVTIYENEVPRVEHEMAVIYPTYEKSQIATKELFEAIANEQNLDISTVSEVLDGMVESISRTPDALMWLAKLKDADNIAYSQALNVSINMMAFASFLALPKKQIKEMGLAGLMQDLGKVKIPQRILQKPTKLTKLEYEHAKLHVEEGLKILKKTPDIPMTVMDMVAQHHERFDGSGYPKQLKGNIISMHGQIAGLIDTYCALTTDRSYALSLHNQEALDEIHQMRDKGFSAELIDQLIQFLGIYPVSSLVELNTGEVAVVIQQNQVRRLQPRLMIILNPDKVKNRAPAVIDLLNAPKSPNGDPYKIVKAVRPEVFGLSGKDFYI